MKHLNQDQRKALLNHLSGQDSLGALAIEVLVRTGCRTHELMRLDADSFDERRGFVRIKAAKGSNDHLVAVPQDFAKRCRGMIGARESIADLLGFDNVQSAKRFMRRTWAKMRLAVFGDKARDVSLHGLRASFAVALYENTKDVLLVKELLGHRSIDSTMHYVRITQALNSRDRILKAL